ncbi:MAG: UDP-N-acetylglucosamine--N-acetylmuramyl-(pentapeptide) pyrophosphoryl-undecaprenol N-acetylglucosamine transferase [Phycisphaeraceae bacterium]|nr:MAG: UDP-N-acetylglucosamine--N-acetylmuramyl-(pentapeptide) pyrophosphoryl-undecaprenol N-acetylglucosamine transferase [Phycisphaeraceae bacterium]
MSGPSFIFAGGGTGGHIFPALAIAGALRASADVRTHVVCSDRPLDAQMLEASVARGEVDRFTSIPARPFGLRPRALGRLVASWGVCVRAVRAIIQSEKAEAESVTLVAMGGFVSAPAVQAARAERCRVVLVNLDAAAGLANRWIARRVDERFAVVAAPDKPAGLDWTVVHPIVRAGVLVPRSPADARRAFGLDPERPTLLVTGGSQGARSINNFIAAFVARHRASLRNWQVIHQCGSEDPGALEMLYEAAGVRALVVPFIDSMADAWAAADAALARAGAGTVAEAWATATPTLFLPYPYHADLHQRRNAEPLVAAGGSLLAADLIDPGSNLEAHGGALLGLIEGNPERERMRAALRGLGPADGASSISATLLGGFRRDPL